jgi:hypothetical protein
VKQRALRAGVLANPYRFIEAGQEFEYHQALSWAEPVDGDLDEGVPDADAEPAATPRRRKRPEASPPAGSEADPI